MANIVVTTTATRIDVVFNDYATMLDMVKASWSKQYIADFVLKTNCVLVDIEGQRDWCVSFDGTTGTLQIDSVDGVAPTSTINILVI